MAFFFFICLAILAGPSRSAGQQPSSQSSPSGQQHTRTADKPGAAARAGGSNAQTGPQSDKEDVVRISVTLVQVDAVVTDGKGRYVTNLKPDDFEISEDGKRQPITNFSYVETQPATAPSNHTENLPPAPLRPESVRRTIALVVDDLGLSFESTAYVRAALKKFVNEQVQPGDLVAIVRTSAGSGALQQFTNDRRILNAAIERVRWNAFGRSGVSAFTPIAGLGRSLTPGSNDTVAEGETVEHFREELFTVGTLGGVNFVIRALRDLPGRKSVLLFSDGIRLFPKGRADLNQRVVQAVRRLTDLANRSSVVIYTMDARGLQTAGITATDRPNGTGLRVVQNGIAPEIRSGLDPDDIRNQESLRHEELFNTQDGLQYLAKQTGGFFIRDTNDLNRGIRQVLDDQRGYYLLGYVPEASSFRPTRSGVPFHKISVRVKDPGLRVRSRTGFYGVSDEVFRPKPQTPVQQLLAALTSPFASGEIGLKLTSLFGHDPKAGAFVRSMLHIDPREITFTQEPDGQHKGVIDIAAFTFGVNGELVNQESREYTFRVPEAEFDQFKRQGLLYNLTVPIKKPGAYQLRVAVRDTASEKTGAANQFIEVPDVAKKRLALSSLVVGGSDPAKQSRQSAVEVVNAAEGQVDARDVERGPSERILRRGEQLHFGLAIYNATVTGATGRPQLEGQVIMLRDGKTIYTGQPAAIDLTGQTDWKQVVAGGKLLLGPQLEPGEYVLQVIITDRLAKEKYNSATQWIDFEIAK
jgi:VWFA-related protein